MSDATMGKVRIAADIRGARSGYEEIEVGKELGSADFLVTQEQIDQFCELTGDHHPYYEVNSPFGGTVVPVSLTYLLPRNLFSRTYSVRGLFYKWAFELFEPMKPDVHYTVSAKLTEKWIRNEREFVAYEAICQDPEGVTVYTTRRAHVLDFIPRTAPKTAINGMASSDERSIVGRESRKPYVDKERSSESAAGSGIVDIVPLARKTAEIGTPMPSFSTFYSQHELERRWRTAVATPQKNLHVDPEVARQEGLPSPVASGPHVIELVFRSALEFFGEGWIKGGKADLTVARPTFAGDYVTALGAVTAAVSDSNGSDRLACDVQVTNQAGQVKVIGKVSGLV
jgi:acyl dehydratase